MEEISTTPQERAQLKFEFYIVLFFFFFGCHLHRITFRFFLCWLPAIIKRITHRRWWALKCFWFYMIIHYTMKPKYKTSITLLMAATNIKLESCSLAAPSRDYSADAGRARWLTALTHCEKHALPSLGNRFSLLCDSHRFSSSVTTPANQSRGSVQGLWLYLLTLKTHWLHHKTPSDTK